MTQSVKKITFDITDYRRFYIQYIEGTPTLYWQRNSHQPPEWNSCYADKPAGGQSGRVLWEGRQHKVKDILSRMLELQNSFGYQWDRQDDWEPETEI